MFWMLRRMCVVVTVLLVGLGLVRAATFKFQEKTKAVLEACSKESKQLGLSKEAAFAREPSPTITLVTGSRLAPGRANQFTISGTFSPRTEFIIENDNITVTNETLTRTQYRATASVAPGTGPQTAALMAIAPISGGTARLSGALIVDAKTEWTMDTSNGWRITARPAGEVKEGIEPEFPYELSFFRKGETTAFAKRSATLHYDMWSSVEPYTFAIEEETPAATLDMESLVKRMQDPKLTDAQRDQLMKDMQKVTANMQKMADPANIAKMEQDRQSFGCQNIYAGVDAAGSVKGRLRCSDKLGKLTLTGTFKIIGQ